MELSAPLTSPILVTLPPLGEKVFPFAILQILITLLLLFGEF
jgi:hypothetical protein